MNHAHVVVITGLGTTGFRIHKTSHVTEAKCQSSRSLSASRSTCFGVPTGCGR